LLSHFSKFIRPGAHRIEVNGDQNDGLIYTAAKNIDGSLVLVIFNKNEVGYSINLELEGQFYNMKMAPRALQTIYLRHK
jgi:glucosylceramidase